MGALISANDIGFLVTVLAVSHFGKHAHIPRLLCAAYIIFGLSSALIAATYFISPVNSEVGSSTYSVDDVLTRENTNTNPLAPHLNTLEYSIRPAVLTITINYNITIHHQPCDTRDEHIRVLHQSFDN